MSERICLSGEDWQFRDYYGEDWRWRDAHQPNSRDQRFWRTGRVPGSVHHDLWQAGEIPNPYFERNSLLIEWVPARTWLYKKTFFAPEHLRGQRVRLCFEGVDYAAEFFLNGQSLGQHQGMYTPAIFEVSDQLVYGAENLLVVVIEPAPPEQPQVSRTSRVRTHKSRMTYWWDFCPRMIHVGIWDEVYLEATGSVRIENVFVRPQLREDLQQADVSVSIALDAARQQVVMVETTLHLDGEVVASQRTRHALAVGRTSLNQCLTIHQPRLWWPNGHGEQPLYQAEVQVWAAEDGAAEPPPMDARTVLFGIRSITLVPNDTEDASARPYTFVVNGRKLYIKGWNWVPMDVMYGVPRPEKLERLLRLAQRAGVNLLRVWGGGLIEKEAFYNWCDRLGIMVWQEFIQSSSGIENYPPETPEFIELMTAEATQIIPRRRNHPSLVLWCGGNELTAGEEQPLDDHHPLLAALHAVVRQLDPDRLWLPTSPTGRVFSNSLDNIQQDPLALHDVHGPWEYQGVTGQYALYNQGTALLHSEFGVEGITNLRTLNATIAPEHQWPVSRDNVYWHHLGAWWVQEAAWQAAFGDVADVETLVKATQMTQAEGLRYAVEADRRRKYQNSGTLPWQFNEPYPMAACTSAVDYYTQPRPVYYAVAHAYEPVHVSAQFPTAAWAGWQQVEAALWVNNSHEAAFADARLTCKIVGLRGQVYLEQAAPVHVPGNSAARLASVALSLNAVDEDIFFLDLDLRDRDGQQISGSRYVFTRTANFAPLLAAPAAALKIHKEEQADSWQVTVTSTGAQAALFVWLEDAREMGAGGAVYFDTNYFCLFPTEARTVSVLWHDVPPAERRLHAGGWNTERWALDASYTG